MSFYRRLIVLIYLGIFIDSNLSWENHIDYIYNKIIKFVVIFYKIRYK